MKNVSEYISTWDVFYGGNAAEQRTMTTTRHKQHKSGNYILDKTKYDW